MRSASASPSANCSPSSARRVSRPSGLSLYGDFFWATRAPTFIGSSGVWSCRCKVTLFLLASQPSTLRRRSSDFRDEVLRQERVHVHAELRIHLVDHGLAAELVRRFLQHVAKKVEAHAG